MDYAMSIGFDLCALDFSPIKGPEGNIEYLVRLDQKLEDGCAVDEKQIILVVKEAHQSLDQAGKQHK